MSQAVMCAGGVLYVITVWCDQCKGTLWRSIPAGMPVMNFRDWHGKRQRRRCKTHVAATKWMYNTFTDSSPNILCYAHTRVHIYPLRHAESSVIVSRLIIIRGFIYSLH